MAVTPRTHRRLAGRSLLTIGVGLALAAIFAVVGVVATPAQQSEAATNTRIPGINRFAVPAETHQVVLVRTASASTSYAQVETWRRASASQPWVRTSGPQPGRVGYNGVSPTRVQGSGKTPSGMFRLLGSFGPGPNPGTTNGWTRFDERHYWVYDPKDPATYNMIQQRLPGKSYAWSPSSAEHLVDWGDQEYKYATVVDFNKAGTGRSDVRLGGGIFLHANGSGATAGCVSVTEKYDLSIVRWLKPAEKPRIVIGTSAWLAATP
ncbi:L,D-transpeptidase family protein [Actinopolymorpha pittospori]|uniref:L,D-peptidoglycan transpeptidase YkuD (ErfK/YbiS/YcfS/YnhG family) n=1 Tax=Actinopolymorpha pittospori TaxID=648752 RepID=A0A927MQ35_9ACTN|nr:L,D-transpeptidase family protein [Actinopolymorpha pittospori]MBE1604599.1 L,D-peptidoglycan transpeptidase YkuD (ErfK/YbiS/YcfS/YnhG family) [Actinopolymorpha pittospori]